MRNILAKYRTCITVALLSFLAFLLLPIMTSGCIPYFDKNQMICSNRWNWFGGFHVINQKLHSLMNVSLDEWHNYIMYEMSSLWVLLISATLMGAMTYLLFNLLRSKKQSKIKKSKNIIANPLVLPLVLLLVVLGLNLILYRATYAQRYQSVRIMAPGEGIFVPDVGVVPSDVNGNGPQECMNNKPERCVLAPTVDLYPSPGESMHNPDLRSDEKSAMKEIGGVLTGYSGNTITLKTTTGRLFNITFPVDIIAWWNKDRSPNYDGYQLSNGEIITVMYLEPITEHSTDIKPSQIVSSHFAIEPQPKTDTGPIKRYSGSLE